MAGKKDQVSREAFMTAWETAANVEEASKATGLKPTSLMARASKMRSDGVPLKLMARGAKKLDVAEANAFLAKLRGTTIEAINQEVEARLVEKTETPVETPVA